MMQKSLALRLRVLRAERRATLREVEAETGVAKETLSELERGRRRPKDVTLAKLADFYGVPVAELLEEPVPLGEASGEAGSPEKERLEADFPKDPQQWERVLASVRERQNVVEAKVDELVKASAHNEVDPNEVKRVLDEVEDCEITLLLALPGSQRQGRNQITINPSLAAPDQWNEFLNVSQFSEDIGKRLAEAGLVVLKERAGQKPEPVPVGI